MATIERFEDIESWKMARERKISALILAGRFRKNYALINQVRAASGSIMDYIAEGFERRTRVQFIMFLGYAKGSCGELRSQLFRALDCNFFSKSEFEELKNMTESISRLIQKLVGYLQKTKISGLRGKRGPKQP